MDQENEKNGVRVEDRRFFDKDGNPIRQDERQSPQQPSAASEQKEKEETRTPHVKIDFASLVFLYVQTTLMHLGELEDSADHKVPQNLEAAQQMIDTLELLQEKTRGNLTPQEDQYLQGVLFDLRMRYVHKARKS
ncbi:DUF1844 domain-containing protein [bacterium]|nr:DUF1844 domain-containing protein [bacterium]MCI0602778.1 DUF1844 domain-containing protein [bacterium]